ncbi:MAG: DNA replication/repair protein RecF [Clostridia bacterium]|nr:DNA replication/repair protein RecF [Clostridia bacterium]
MFVSKLEFENYRNLKDGSFEPSNEINVIFGDNAQGKTNLIEAIWLFCGQKSFRQVKDPQLVKLTDATEPLTAKLKMSFFAAGREQKAQININQKRSASINGISLDTPSNLSESFCCVVFSPADMDLIKDGPVVRRKFLDNAISQLRPKYAKMLSVYNRSVMQRNAILRDVMFHSELEFMLDAYEDRIAKSGAYIVSQRKKYLEAIMEYAPEIYFGISGQRETFNIEYKCSTKDGSYESLIDALRINRGEDTKNGTTGVGPHRDDIEFFINSLPVKTYASQGQRRSVILALKLSEAEVLKRFSGEQPIAILDDVMSELDHSRQDFILNHIKGWQVFITCCDPDTVKMLNSGKCFKVENGKVFAVKE